MISIRRNLRIRRLLITFGDAYTHFKTSCLYIPIENERAEVQDLGFPPINDGVQNKLGERMCKHLNVKGEFEAFKTMELETREFGDQIGYQGYFRSNNGDKSLVSGYCYEPPVIGNEMTISRPGYDGTINVSCNAETKQVIVKCNITAWHYGSRILPVTNVGAPVVVSFSGGNTSGSISVAFKHYLGWSDIVNIVSVTWSVPLSIDEVAGESLPLSVVHASNTLKVMDDVVLCQRWSAPVNEGKLYDKAFSALKDIDINSLCYGRDIIHLAPDMKKLIKDLKRIKSPKVWANLWFQYRYGIRLFMLDTLEIRKSLSQRREYHGAVRRIHCAAKDVAHGCYSEQDVTTVSHITLFVSEVSRQERSLARTLRDFDLFPSLENMWDFIPYSFVVDWIIPIGTILSEFDSLIDTVIYPILGATISHKTVAKASAIGSYSGSAEVSLFERYFTATPALSRLLSTNLDFGGGITLVHGIDSLGLAVQAKR